MSTAQPEKSTLRQRAHRGQAHLCPVGHTLRPFTVPDADWQCSSCLRPYARGEQVMRCRPCDHDVCVNCFQGLTPSPADFSEADHIEAWDSLPALLILISLAS